MIFLSLLIACLGLIGAFIGLSLGMLLNEVYMLDYYTAQWFPLVGAVIGVVSAVLLFHFT